MFARIPGILYRGEGAAGADRHGVAWWAMRTAASSVGYYEAGWALKAACGTATSAGLTQDAVREPARAGVMARWRVE